MNGRKVVALYSLNVLLDLRLVLTILVEDMAPCRGDEA